MSCVLRVGFLLDSITLPFVCPWPSKKYQVLLNKVLAHGWALNPIKKVFGYSNNIYIATATVGISCQQVTILAQSVHT